MKEDKKKAENINNVSTSLVEQLLSRKDFSTLSTELPRMQKYLHRSLRIRVWNEIASYYLARKDYVAYVLSSNRLRTEEIRNHEFVAMFVLSVQRFLDVYGPQLTSSDLEQLKGVVLRIKHFYEVMARDRKAILIAVSRLAASIDECTLKSKPSLDGPISEEVTKLCYGLDEQMTTEEVHVEMARILSPAIVELYNKQTRQTRNASTEKRSREMKTKKKK